MNRFQRISELIILSLEETISEEQVAELSDYIAHDPQARDYYLEYVDIHASLCQTVDLVELVYPNSDSENILYDVVKKDLTYSALRQDLIEAEVLREKTRSLAEETLAKYLEDQQSRQAAEIQVKQPAKTSALKIYSFLLKTAAVLIFVLALLFVNTLLKREASRPQVVATLTETVNAKWDNAENDYAPGTLFYTDDTPLHLTEGLVKIKFNQGSEVIVSAPSEFNFISASRMHLEKGRLCAKVPPHGSGFTVHAPGCSIIDLGTEFGVIAVSEGLSEAHVLDGMVELQEDNNGDKRISQRLVNGQVGSFSRASKIHVESRAAQPTAFVREMPQEETISVPGRILDLADVVGGGNGFGTGRRDFGLNPLSGAFEQIHHDVREGAGKYLSTPHIPYIDGVFVPNGESGLIQISSEGRLFDECPRTSNTFSAGIINAAANPVSMLNGRQYGTRKEPCLFMPANLGITFDLDAIRSEMAGVNITQFTSLLGVSDGAPRPEKTDADVWVLVDGTVRFSMKRLRKMIVPVQINLRPEDRFLTFIITDGEYPPEHPDKNRINQSTESDWCLFVKPVLKLEDK